MKKSPEAGFTLVEVAVSTLVMTVVFLAIAGVFNTLTQVNARANTLTIVTQLTQQQLEKYRNTAYTSIPIGTTDVSGILTPYRNIGSPKSAVVTVTQVNANGLKSVDITVNYHDANRPKSVKVTTFVAQNGINK